MVEPAYESTGPLLNSRACLRILDLVTSAEPLWALWSSLKAHHYVITL